MKNQKLISRNVIRRYKFGDIVRLKNGTFYMDNGHGGVIPVYEQKVPGSSKSIVYNGKTYYYTPNTMSFTPNSEIQNAFRDSQFNNAQQTINQVANQVKQLSKTYGKSNLKKRQQEATNKSNSTINKQPQKITQSVNPTRTNTQQLSQDNWTPWLNTDNNWTPWLNTNNQSVSPKTTTNDSTDNTSANSQTNQTNVERPSTGNYTYEQLRQKLSSMTDEELNKEIKNKQRGYNVSFVISELGRRPKQQRSPQRQQSSLSNNTREEVQTTEPTMEDIMSNEAVAYLVNNGMEANQALATVGALNSDQLKQMYSKIQQEYMNTAPVIEEKPVQQTTSSTSPFAGTTPSSVDLNRADVRAIMSHYGLDTTPSQRKAFRKYLAGDRSQDISFIDQNSNLHKDWVAPFIVYKKKGGRLISRNPINRFKSK